MWASEPFGQVRISVTTPFCSDRIDKTQPHPATNARAAWIDSVLEADLSAPRKRRHTAKRVYDRAVTEMGYELPIRPGGGPESLRSPQRCNFLLPTLLL